MSKREEIEYWLMTNVTWKPELTEKEVMDHIKTLANRYFHGGRTPMPSRAYPRVRLACETGDAMAWRRLPKVIE